MRAARVANSPRSYKFIVSFSRLGLPGVRGGSALMIGGGSLRAAASFLRNKNLSCLAGGGGRWFVYIASTPPRLPQAGGIMSIFLPLSARARLSLYVCPYIYFYIYIGPYGGRVKFWGGYFPGCWFMCVTAAPSSPPGRGGKLHPENRIYFLMQGAAVYRCFAPPIKHAPGSLIPWPLPASRLRRWVDGLGRPPFMGAKFIKFCQVSGAVILARCTPRGPGVLFYFYSTLENARFTLK